MKSSDDHHAQKCGHAYMVVDRFFAMNDNKKNLKTLLGNQSRRFRVSERKCKGQCNSILRPSFANFPYRGYHANV